MMLVRVSVIDGLKLRSSMLTYWYHQSDDKAGGRKKNMSAWVQSACRRFTEGRGKDGEKGAGNVKGKGGK